MQSLLNHLAEALGVELAEVEKAIVSYFQASVQPAGKAKIVISSKKSAPKADSDAESDSEDTPKPKAKPAKGKPAKAESDAEDEDEEKPKPSAKKPAPKAKKAPKGKPAKVESDAEDEEEDAEEKPKPSAKKPAPKGKKAKGKPVEDEEEDAEEKPKSAKKSAPAKKSATTKDKLAKHIENAISVEFEIEEDDDGDLVDKASNITFRQGEDESMIVVGVKEDGKIRRLTASEYTQLTNAGIEVDSKAKPQAKSVSRTPVEESEAEEEPEADEEDAEDE